MHSFALKTSLVLPCLALVLVLQSGNLHAAESDEMKVLELFYDEKNLVVTPTRTAKSISQIAENVTVITAEEIKAMNAHSVADVLDTVTGVQLLNAYGPGSSPEVMAQGSESRHVLVLIDGVSQNNLSDGFPDVGTMRVQHVERIEIVKGPASSSWGSSLGGVINIITKSPDDSRKFGGTIVTSIGERNTGDYRGEASGAIGSFGYYLSGGGFLTDGLQAATDLRSGNIYSKLQWKPADDSVITLSIGYDTGSRGIGVIPLPYGSIPFRNRYDNFFSSLSLSQRISQSLSLDVAFRSSYRKVALSTKEAGTGIESGYSSGKDTTFGGNARLNWEKGRNNLVLGTDFDFGALDSPNIADHHQRLDKWAIYSNDTIRLGRFSLTPGLRYDYTSTNGDFTSPSLGVTCAISDSTIIRGYVARGFNTPALGFTFGSTQLSVPNPDLKMEKVWSYSAGFESAVLTHIWVKATYFHHDVSDALTSVLLPSGYFTTINAGKQKREGVEVELKTTPVFHLALTGGFTFINAKDLTTGEVVKDVPRYAYDVGIQYDDSRFLRALLKGRYIDYNSSPDNNGKYTTMIWDLNLSKEFQISQGMTAEAFFTAHNLFNGAQYSLYVYTNPRRWFEGGLRFSF
jgi:vitamin B12 transporter